MQVIERMRRIFELYGFQPLETPAMEKVEILSGKYGEEGDKLSYRVLKRGAELDRALEKVKGGAPASELADLGVRYDLTVPLARVVAQYGGRLPKPFKRYQIAPVWRADRPQQGRYREFMQCDVDIVGTDERMADTELLALMVEVFDMLELSDVVVNLNHRDLLKALSAANGNTPDKFPKFCTALDKHDKIGMDAVIGEMKEQGLSINAEGSLRALGASTSQLGGENSPEAWTILDGLFRDNPDGQRAVGHVFDIISACSWFGIPEGRVKFNPVLARGLDYYTGPIFEAIIPGSGSGSLSGGGRYDELVGNFAGHRIPATGTSFGIDRITDIMIERGLLKLLDRGTEVAIITLEGGVDSHAYSGRVFRCLHKAEVPCEFHYHVAGTLKQHIQAAVRRKNGFIVFIGSDETKMYGEFAKSPETVEGELPITIKRLADGVQKTLTLNEAVKWIKSPVESGLSGYRPAPA